MRKRLELSGPEHQNRFPVQWCPIISDFFQIQKTRTVADQSLAIQVLGIFNEQLKTTI